MLKSISSALPDVEQKRIKLNALPIGAVSGKILDTSEANAQEHAALNGTAKSTVGYPTVEIWFYSDDHFLCPFLNYSSIDGNDSFLQ